MERKAIKTSQIYPYDMYASSHAVKAGNTIYISGMAPTNAEGNVLHEGDVAAQCADSFENMKAVLEEAGASLKDVVNYDVYILDNGDWDKIAETRKRYFNTDPLPACVGVVVKELYPPGILIEIGAIAVVDD